MWFEANVTDSKQHLGYICQMHLLQVHHVVNLKYVQKAVCNLSQASNNYSRNTVTLLLTT